jgi:hypothetical protein
MGRPGSCTSSRRDWHHGNDVWLAELRASIFARNALDDEDEEHSREKVQDYRKPIDPMNMDDIDGTCLAHT